MFKINILAVGKNKDCWVDESITHYLKLLKKYADLSVIYIPDVRQSKNFSEKELRKAEAVLIENKFASDYRIALSDRGKSLNSFQFAAFLSDIMIKQGRCDFIIGGIFGLDDSILKQCACTLSFSPMTFSHQLIRPILLEQLYRGFSIISGGKYHK
jgi:23S rRNA (pseudouridine1915-N3)-methyltransferase